MAIVAVGGALGSFIFALKVANDESAADAAWWAMTSKFGSAGCQAPGAASQCAVMRSTQETVDADKTFMIAGGVIAGTAFVGAVAYYFLGPDKGNDDAAVSRSKVVPWFGAGVGGLSLSSSF